MANQCHSHSHSQSKVSPTRDFSRITHSVEIEDYLGDTFGEEDPLEELRNYLYPDSEDETVIDLSSANSIKEILDILKQWSHEHPGERRPLEHIAQAFASLLHLRKVTHSC